jgi:hypothetical protein
MDSMEDNKNYGLGLISVHTDYSILRYSPNSLKVVPKKPLTKKEQRLIFELDFPELAKIYARAFSNLLSAGETPDDLVQEAYLKLPDYFARYDKAFLTPSQRKDINQLRSAFKGWFNITAKFYRDKTYEKLKLYRDTKYGNGKRQAFVMTEKGFDSLQSISSDEMLKQEFLKVRRKLWSQLPEGPKSSFQKDPKCSNLQVIVDMKDSDATIGTLHFQFGQFGWTRDERIEALQIIEKYYDQLWEETHYLTGQEHSNWASDWLDAIENGSETSFIKSQHKSNLRKVA